MCTMARRIARVLVLDSFEWLGWQDVWCLEFSTHQYPPPTTRNMGPFPLLHFWFIQHILFIIIHSSFKSNQTPILTLSLVKHSPDQAFRDYKLLSDLLFLIIWSTTVTKSGCCIQSDNHIYIVSVWTSWNSS